MALDINNVIIKLVLNDDTTYIKIRYKKRSTLALYFANDSVLAKIHGIKGGQMVVDKNNLKKVIPLPKLPDGCKYDITPHNRNDFEDIGFDDTTLHFLLKNDAPCSTAIDFVVICDDDTLDCSPDGAVKLDVLQFRPSYDIKDEYCDGKKITLYHCTDRIREYNWSHIDFMIRNIGVNFSLVVNDGNDFYFPAPIIDGDTNHY
jgi:hypothetical protein